MMNLKNFGLSPAAADLGLGDTLKAQVEENELERKKKLSKFSERTSLMGAAAGQLFGAGGVGG